MSETIEQTNETRALCLINWYLCDRFRDVFIDGFCDCMVWPFEVVNPVLHALTLEAIRNFDVLSSGFTSDLSRYAKTKLKADLNSLAKYLSAWNESKRVVFCDDKLPGSATVSSVEDQNINRYMAEKLQQQRTNFAAADVNFYTRLYDYNQKKVKQLFSFTGESYDAVKYRNEYKLRGQQDALGVFEVSHEVVVCERDKGRYYRAYASTDQFTAISYENAIVSPQTLAKRAGLTEGETHNVSMVASCTETVSIALPKAKYMCDVDMKIDHQTDAHIWVHPLTGVLSFGIVAACNHRQAFTGTIDAKFQMTVRKESIKPAYVWIDVSSLMDMLIGNTIVRLEHGAQLVSVCPESKELRLVSRDGHREDAKSLFKLHPAENGSFLLSTLPSSDAGEQWVCVRNDKLVANDVDGYGSDKFVVHRLSTSYNDWIVQERRTQKNIIVVAKDNALVLEVKELSRQEASTFSFVRPLYGETD
ncbi:hypothetical protein DD237_004153 [Peronospora effusa]|uniref:Uncharacterized protein n=1 Tax=Peronospora effusa TaxID=542832 RepID=A0A3R7W1U6_9STRA|nr:hypothetical protein DD237_004153 [Peronospora effusa]